MTERRQTGMTNWAASILLALLTGAMLPLTLHAQAVRLVVVEEDGEGADFPPVPDTQDAQPFRLGFAGMIISGTMVRGGIEEPAIGNLTRRQVILVRIADQDFEWSVFGEWLDLSAAENRLHTLLSQKIAFAERLCGLTSAQKQRLELAGRGDIARFFRRLEAVRRGPQVFRVPANAERADGLLEWARSFADALRPLKNTYQAGLFGSDSLFARVRVKLLTPEQLAMDDAVQAIQKAGGKFTLRSREGGPDTIVEVRVVRTAFDDGDMAHLRYTPGLHSLLLDDTRITDAGLVHLKDLVQLETLELRNTRLNGAGLAHLSGLNSLASLDLQKTEVTDAGLESLSRLTSLRKLNLEQTQITDAGLVHIRGLTNLESLHLGRTQITGAGLTQLSGLTNLHDLFLGKTQISDAGLESLRGLTALEHLSLTETRVTDAGLPNLRRLTNLQRLFVIQSGVTGSGTVELRQALPKLTVIR